MKLKNRILFLEIENETMGVPAGLDEGGYTGMMKVNGTARDIIELLENEISMDELTAKMLEQYDIDEEKLRSDIQSVIDVLNSKGLLEG